MMSSKRSGAKQRFSPMLVVFLVILLIALVMYPNMSQAKARKMDEVWTKYPKYNKIDLKKWIQAISDHETNGGTSTLARKYNNYFGMGLARIRPTTGKPSGFKIDGYELAKYNSKADSYEDYLLWLESNFAPNFTSPQQLIQFMKNKGYFEDSLSNYLDGVARWMK